MKNFFVEVHKSARGKIRVHILELLRRSMKCYCFGVDCCKGIMKEPSIDGSTKVYSWIENDEKKYGTYKEACDASDAAKKAGKRPPCLSCGAS